jgi:chorismate mutase
MDAINLGGKIMAAYLRLVPRICRPGKDGHFGSSVEHDVYALQAIARRIHYGALYVGESKFRSDPARYTKLMHAKDRRGMLALLTRKDVEEKIIARIRGKVAAAQAKVNRGIRHVIDAREILRFYRDCIIPLTKEGEVLYLFNRVADIPS